MLNAPQYIMRKPTLILVLFLLLGFVYAVTTPIFEASDELWHYPLARHLAEGNPLPVQDPENVGPWKQEASQQPLYYYLAAALTFWIDTSDMETVRWLNPHVDNGILTVDGNTNLVVHRPQQESFPWHGTVLAVRLIRLLSVLMGAGTVYLTWCIARILFPHQPELALGASAVNAFTPMFLFISGAVNNDNLAMLLCSAALFLMLRTHPREPRTGDSLTLGITLGLAALTKTSALGLVPLGILSLLIAVWLQNARPRRNQVVFLARHTLLIVLPVLLIAGWWYYRNFQLYGDWLGWNAFIQVLGQRAHPASLRQLWGERWGFSLSYWGLFGGVNIPMPTWIYRLLNGAAAVAFVGVAFYLIRLLAGIRYTKAGAWVREAILQSWPFALLALWTVAIVAGLIRWATVTWSSQGRLIFPAISALSVLLVTGLVGWLPVPRPGGPEPTRPWLRCTARWGLLLWGSFLFAISAAAPWAWIAPAYRPPNPPTDPQVADLSDPLEIEFGGQLRLLGYHLTPSGLEPGDQLELTLFWEALAPMERDWSVFVHLNDPLIDAPIAQRDMYPGQGLLATSLLSPGQRVANRYVITVPGTTYSPTQARLVVGLYDYANWERLLTSDGRDAVTIQEIAMIPSGQSQFPNPVHFNFGDKIALIGYQIEPRRLRPGETLTLTLIWQALDDMGIDYTVFTHLRDLEDPSNRIYGQHDAMAPGGTTTWQVGQIVEARYELELAQDTPAAVHEIEIGIYYRDADGGFPRLQLVTADGRLVDDFLILGKVRVD
jgi:hypothetical protein